jgi:hypothetical protein
VDTVPEPTAGPTPPLRRAAMETYLAAESPEQYRKKMARD